MCTCFHYTSVHSSICPSIGHGSSVLLYLSSHLSSFHTHLSTLSFYLPIHLSLSITPLQEVSQTSLPLSFTIHQCSSVHLHFTFHLIYPFTYLSINASACHQSINPPVHLSVCPSVTYSSLYPSSNLSIHLSLHPSI